MVAKSLTEPTRSDNWDPETTIKRGVIWPYCGNSVAIWHCPADKSLGQPPAGPKVPRPRSRSMNIWVGGHGDYPESRYTPKTSAEGYPVGRGKVFLKMTEMDRPGPAMTFVLLDEREDSIKDGAFLSICTSIRTLPIPDFGTSPPVTTTGRYWPFPSPTGIRRSGWVNPRTTPPLSQTTVRASALSWGLTISPNNKDVQWLQEHSTREY